MIFPHTTLWVGRVHDCSQMCTLNHVAQHDCKFPKQVCAECWLTHSTTIYQKRSQNIAIDRNILLRSNSNEQFFLKIVLCSNKSLG